jgi:hypothetical protein
MARGKNINLYLMDGTPSGRIKCTLANWTGVVYKIPRTELEKCKDRIDLSQSGVYFLFGTDEETGRLVAYIGQAGARKNGEGILYRLLEHKRNPDKNYWTEAIIFTTSNNSFGPTEISYLENKFCSMALNAGRYIIKNGNDPNAGSITEEKESELEEFVAYAGIAMGTLGHRVFEALVSVPAPRILVQPSAALTLPDSAVVQENPIPPVNAVVFTLKVGKANAKGQRTSDGFVLLAGGRISVLLKSSCRDHVKKLRQQYKQSISNEGVLLVDILLRSPNEAACFVAGSSINAQIAWKSPDGKTLKDIEIAESETIIKRH